MLRSFRLNQSKRFGANRNPRFYSLPNSRRNVKKVGLLLSCSPVHVVYVCSILTSNLANNPFILCLICNAHCRKADEFLFVCIHASNYAIDGFSRLIIFRDSWEVNEPTVQRYRTEEPNKRRYNNTSRRLNCTHSTAAYPTANMQRNNITRRRNK